MNLRKRKRAYVQGRLRDIGERLLASGWQWSQSETAWFRDAAWKDKFEAEAEVRSWGGEAIWQSWMEAAPRPRRKPRRPPAARDKIGRFIARTDETSKQTESQQDAK